MFHQVDSESPTSASYSATYGALLVTPTELQFALCFTAKTSARCRYNPIIMHPEGVLQM